MESEDDGVILKAWELHFNFCVCMHLFGSPCAVHFNCMYNGLENDAK